MSPTLTPSLASIIPEADLAQAVRLAFDTLLSILRDKAATVRDKRMAATAVLRLAPSPFAFAKGEGRGEGSLSTRSSKPPKPACIDGEKQTSTINPSTACSTGARIEREHDHSPAPAKENHAPIVLAAPRTHRPAAALLNAVGSSNRSPIQPRAA